MNNENLNIKIFFYKLIKDKTDNSFIQFFRYLVVSFVALIVDYSLLFCLTEFIHLDPLISNLFSSAAGLIINYILNVIWVFNKRKYNMKIEFLIFVIIGLLGLGLNELILWFFTKIILLHYMISKIISTMIGYLFRFILRKYFLFA